MLTYIIIIFPIIIDSTIGYLIVFYIVERPTFEELRLRLANMIPLQLLVVRDASPQYVDILPYKKGQIITLLEKRFIHFIFLRIFQ